ncbi:pollen-specific leucine-rich repeat extensin-like protein 3 [Selaginella moellendorffii]|nr:pollen-specific leucine-rich repeat extensin-like protein 3 [Selaginella moellendorffii]|eukprot:XP_024537206.1 pollen-specific leucine-rich repeat extensin-like protein 3 [Selaginella moellendorffii]
MELPHSPSPHDFHFPEYFHSPRTLEAVTHPVEAPRSPALVEFPGSEDGHLVTRLPSLAPSPSTPSPVLQAPPPPVAGTPPPPVRRALPPPPGRGNICSTDDTRAHA